MRFTLKKKNKDKKDIKKIIKKSFKLLFDDYYDRYDPTLIIKSRRIKNFIFKFINKTVMIFYPK